MVFEKSFWLFNYTKSWRPPTKNHTKKLIRKSYFSRERIDLTFFDAHTNDSHIDLGHIPLPVQTNVSGQVLTGIAPINIGGFSDPRDILSTLPITGTIVNITHSDTAYFQLTKSNHSQDLSNPNENILTPEDIAEIPEVGEVFPEVKHHPEKIKEDK